MQANRRQFLGTAAAVAAPAPAVQQGTSRTLLSGAWPLERVARALLPRSKWRPYPAAADRAGWQALPEVPRKSLIEAAEKALPGEWTFLPATVFLEYARNGNRSHFERLQFSRRERLRELVMGECAEGKGRFIDEIVNGVWATCEESFWGLPAHLGAQKARAGLPDITEPIVDLFAAETASLMAWTHYLLAPQLGKVNRLIPARIQLEVERRLLGPNRERDDFGWMGLRGSRSLNNWTPWINSNWLACALLLEQDAGRRAAAVHKSLRSLDRFLDGYHEDGGCDEGPGYWTRAGASLFDCLDLLHSATGGAMDFFRIPLVGEMGRYIYRVHIHNDWFINFADAPARVHLPGMLVWRYGRRIGDENMQALGAYARSEGPERESIGRALPAVFHWQELRAAPARQPLVQDAWMPGIQVMAARRRAGSPEGLYLAAQGGHNAESHNHNDVGNFIVFSGGQPVIIDVGVETYTAKTFSSKRYDIWTMQSAYHNLPTIGGVMQAAGRQYAASDVTHTADDKATEFRLNIARAYPAAAGVRSWVRTLRLDRAANQITVEENYALGKAAPQITLTLMTPRKPEPGSGEVRLGDVRVAFDARTFTVKTEEIKLADRRLRGSWGERLWRVLLVAEKPPASGRWLVRIG